MKDKKQSIKTVVTAYMKKIGIVNIILLVMFILSWGGVFIVGDVLGAALWVLIKFVFPMFGIILLIVNIIILLKKKRKDQFIKRTIAFVMSIAYLFPILLLMQIIPMSYPANRNTVKPAVTVHWPLMGETVVGWGGDTFTDNYHTEWAASRWAYDLVMKPYGNGSPKLSDYGIWESQIISPVNGTIIAVYDDEEDISPNRDEFLSQEGNYIYIRIEETGTYLLLNHLRQDSVVVSAGERVVVGDLLGLVGNSGMSSEPHLHIHHQRQDPTRIIHPLIAEGLPLYFYNAENIIFPTKGQIITP